MNRERRIIIAEKSASNIGVHPSSLPSGLLYFRNLGVPVFPKQRTDPQEAEEADTTGRQPSAVALRK